MELINGNTKVLKAVYGILDGTLFPIIVSKNFYYYLDVTKWGNGTLVYTEFNKDTKLPMASYEVKFGSHHLLRHLITEPVTKIKLDFLVHTTLPDAMPDDVDPAIILSYYR
jgi:hypothetical protein